MQTEPMNQYCASLNEQQKTDALLALKSARTCELVAELKTRDGVSSSAIGPDTMITQTARGPAIVLVVID